ncbi:MAG: hypothetical protein KC422_13285 [Trueperaceae bacterium]|nr:hypothetical protein [Trueperaceae bacterium]
MLPPAIICEPSRAPKGFSLEAKFGLRVARASKNAAIAHTEQVSWTQSGYLADRIASVNDLNSFAFPLANQLAQLLQNDPHVLAFLSYGDTSGAMLLYETPTMLVSLFPIDDGSLETRLLQEATSLGKRAFVLELHQEDSYVFELERWILE